MRQHKIIVLITTILILLAFSCNERPDNNGTTDKVQVSNQDNSDKGETKSGAKPKNAGLTEDYTNTNRFIWQKPDMVIDLLGDLENKTVADIGAGTGFFSLRLTPRAEKVIAIDIDPRFINYLDSIKVLELTEDHQHKLEPRLAEPDDPKLSVEEVDIAMIVNTYMFIDNRIKYLNILFDGIKPGGNLLIIDFKKKRTPVGPPSETRIPLYQVEEELYQAGFRKVQTFDTVLDYQYILFAEK